MDCGEIKSANLYLLIALALLASSCRKSETMFELIGPRHSGITFNNLIIENDSVNQLDNENVYNGAGVGIGDFNNDGLPDIFFSGNLVSCRLYLNRGNFRFRDVTDEAGVTGDQEWCRGVAVVDINNDGRPDIYVSATQKRRPEERKNLLFINHGLNKNKIPVFTEEAAEYGLDDDSHTTQASFFDYDNDGDLDVYLVVNEITPRFSPYLFRPVLKNGTNPSTGKLFRNDFDSILDHPVFKDVSREAGIQTEGYSHSAIITDINRDGWKDIYVGNDFLANDLLWINNKNGTFTNELDKYFRHTSSNSMGNEIEDINNDGLVDVVSLDMNPEDNFRKKMMLPPISYQMYQNTERFGYNYQYVRNVLQLNQGECIQDDSVCRPVFSEIGYYAGITATDWSWTPLLTDFDNDGYRDLIISNGFPKDVTDHDFGMYRMKAFNSTPKEVMLRQIPEVKIHNYAFRNNADLTFTDVSGEWGMKIPTFSNGAAYADLDNDGDLDIVTNNINEEASLYRNFSREKDREKSHFIRIKTSGDLQNRQGLGAWIQIWYDNGKTQVWECSPYRGYLSSIENVAHFGLGRVSIVDSIAVKWPDMEMQVLYNVPADREIVADHNDADLKYSWEKASGHENSLFTEITLPAKISHVYKEIDFIDFNIQKLLPHKFSEYGPSLAAGDINGDGLDDFVCGGSAGNSAALFLQQKEGTFIEKLLTDPSKAALKNQDDAGILLFDADLDGDNDLYISSGGYENENGSKSFRDHFYVNDGKGNFTEHDNCFPENFTSKSCVRAADFDHDGDPDLFVGGRVDPWNYPKPVSSFILRNDSQNGKISFTDVTSEIAGDLINIGLVSDALFTDFDNDGWQDLIIAGEWMPLTFLKYENGRFINVTSATGIGNRSGWWTSLAPGDFDNDGDIDYVAGNLGLNSFYRASRKYPVCVYAADFDNNGSYDAFTSIYLSASQQDTTRIEVPVQGRDDAIKQMISMRARFQNYRSYAMSGIEKLFTEEQMKKSLKLAANTFESSYIRNDGNGKFTMIPLPASAQFSALNGIVAEDFDCDGNLDILFNTNDYGTEVSTGRYDALSGLVLRGDGKGNFTAVTASHSGIFIPGNGKAMVSLIGAGGKYLVAAGQNRAPLKLFELKQKTELIRSLPGDVSAEIILKDGRKRKAEFCRGSSFLSQSSGFVIANSTVSRIIISDYLGNNRIVQIPETSIKPNEKIHIPADTRSH